MSNVEQWSLILGFLLPLLIATVMQPKWDPRVRAVVTVVICAGGGAITVAVQGGFTSIHSTLTAMLTVTLAAISFYEKFWKPTGVVPAIEHATSPSPSPAVVTSDPVPVMAPTGGTPPTGGG